MTDTLTLHANGKDYDIPSPPAKIGLALQASYVIATARRRKAEVPGYALARAARYDRLDHSIDEDALSGRMPDGRTAWDTLLEDDVPLVELRRVAGAAYIWTVTGDPVAARMVIDPEAPAGGGAGPKAGTTTAAATTTPKRARGTTTTSPKKSTSGSAGKRK